MNISEKIAASEARATIDTMLLAGKQLDEISKVVSEKHNIVLRPSDIRAYKKYMLLNNSSVVNQVMKVSKDINAYEVPGNSELDKLAMNFSFQKTNEDLDDIYRTIRRLRVLADANPDNASYDTRIKNYYAQAESIRCRVFRHQYENIRRAVLLSQGKKICMAAISVLMPYISKDFKEEALKKFQSAIEPLLDAKAVPNVPSDIEPIDGGMSS